MAIAVATASAATVSTGPFSVGKTVPAVHGADQYCRFVEVNKQHGKWVVLNFECASSPACQQMAKDTQALADLLRANSIPFVYVTVLLAGATDQPANRPDAVDWSMAYGITEPVLHLGGLNLDQTALGHDYFEFYQRANVLGDTIDYAFNNNIACPFWVLIDPTSHIRQTTAGSASASEILTAMGHGELTYTAPADVPAFGLSGYQFAMAYDAQTGSRTEPTSDLTFTPPFTGGFSVASSSQDTSTRSTRTFDLYNAPIGTSPLFHSASFSLSFSNESWQNGIAGSFRHGAATATILDSNNNSSTVFIPADSEANGTVTVGPFTLADLGVASDTVIQKVTVSTDWLRPFPLVYIESLTQSINALNLKKGAAMFLLDPLDTVRLELAPGGNQSKAAHELDIVAARLAAYSGKQITALQAQSLIDLARAAQGILTAPPAGSLRLVAASGTGVARWKSPTSIGMRAPDFTARGQYGPVSLHSFAGKWVILEFCDAWCGPCQAMAKSQQQFTDFLHANHVPFEYVTVLLEDYVSTDVATDSTSVRWAYSNGITSPIVNPSGRPLWQDLLYRQFLLYGLSGIGSGAAISATPTIVVIDPQQRIRSIVVGQQTPDQLLALIGRSDLVFPGGSGYSAPSFSVDNYSVVLTFNGTTSHWSDPGSETILDYNPSEDTGNYFLARGDGQPRSGFTHKVATEFLNDGVPAPDNVGFISQPFPRTTPLGFVISNITWQSAGPGALLPAQSTLGVHGSDSQFYSYPAELNVDTNGTISAGPFTGDSLGLPAGVDPTEVDLNLVWVRPESYVQIQQILVEIPTLKLKSGATAALTSEVQAIEPMLAPGASTKTAIARIARFRKSLADYRAKLTDTAPIADEIDLIAQAILATVQAGH